MKHFFPILSVDYGTICFFAFCGFAFIQLLYCVLIYGRLAFYKKKKDVSALPPISVIIAARNEADNIYENLPALLDQNYPDFEIIVVVNQSTDESKHILQSYQQQYSNLRYTLVEKGRHLRPGKKLSLSIGVKSAKNEHLVLTDADCKPNSRNWLLEISAQFSEQKQIVLGYGPYIKEKGFLNKLIRFDTAWIAVNYMSFALAKVPYMGVGRNLAYTKKVFESTNGFKSHYALPSGDDDLFIQEAAKKKNYTISTHPDGFMHSEAEKTWESWVLQKSRHHTTSVRYQFIKKALLGIYPLSLILVYFFFVLLMVNENYRWITLTIMVFLIGIKWLIQGRCFYKLNERSFIGLFLLSDLFYSILTPILYYTSDNKRTNRW